MITGADSSWAPEAQGLRALHVPLVTGGQIDRARVGAAGVARAAAQHEASRGELAPTARRLSSGDPAIPTAHVQH